MPVYNVIKDYVPEGKQGGGPVTVEVSARALMAVFRYARPDAAFSHVNPKSVLLDSADNQQLVGQLLFQTPLIIVSDIQSVSVSQNLSNHVSNMQAQLRSSVNYLSCVLPGDHVFVWMMQDPKRLDSLLTRLKEGDACNEFMDGLKFWGKIGNVRKRVAVSGDTGIRQTSFSVSASGFTELDASVYYEPSLAGTATGDAVGWFKHLGLDLNKVVESSGGAKGGIAINKILPLLISVFLGGGIPKNAGAINAGPSTGPNINTTAGADNPFSFIIPQSVARVFGVSTSQNVKLLDLLEFVHGVQRFRGTNDTFRFALPDPFSVQSNILEPGAFARDRYTRLPQQGVFTPSLPALTGQKTLWGILTTYLNPVINQLFTGLRVSPDGSPNGNIMPTVICRQLPLNSGAISESFVPVTDDIRKQITFTENELAEEQKRSKKVVYTDRKGVKHQTVQNADQIKELKAQLAELNSNLSANSTIKDIPVTRIFEIPRWVIDPVLVKSLDIGRADAMRLNFVHIQIESGSHRDDMTSQTVRNPPVRNEIDMARHGMRPYIQTVHAAGADIVTNAAAGWQHVMADILMNQDLTLNGTLNCYGIVHPINPGDALEIEGTVFHIESVSHSFSSAENGRTHFATSISLTHGLGVEKVGDTYVTTYKAVRDVGDMTGFDPAIERVDTIEQGDLTPVPAKDSQTSDVQQSIMSEFSSADRKARE